MKKKQFLISFLLGWLTTMTIAMPADSAEKFLLTFGAAELSLSIKSLKTYAETGEIEADLAFVIGLLTPKQQANFRKNLQDTLQLEAGQIEATNTFFSRPIGQNILARLGDIVKTENKENGRLGLLTAWEKSINSPQGLNTINLLENFPGESIRIDLKRAAQLSLKVAEIVREDDIIFNWLQKQAIALNPEIDAEIKNLPDLRLAGKFQWKKESFTFVNPLRDRLSPVDIYVPLDRIQAPVIIISHGLGSDRYAFDYLAQHLASHGYVVVVPEHIDTSAEALQRLFAGFDRPPDPEIFRQRPLDIKYVLDFIEAKIKDDPVWNDLINWEQIGAIGQSFGGYTVLAAGGAKVDFPSLQNYCNEENLIDTLNVSEFLQCSAADIKADDDDLQDPRIKAVISINPISSKLFDQAGFSQMQIPVMILANTEDIFAPALPEQIKPFTWLTNQNKYLVITQGGTHFTYLSDVQSEQGLPIPPALIGPDRTPAYGYLKALSLAFFNTYVQEQSNYLPYLTENYLRSIEQDSLKLNLIFSLTQSQIEEANTQK